MTPIPDGTGPQTNAVQGIEAKNAAWWAAARVALHRSPEHTLTQADLLTESWARVLESPPASQQLRVRLLDLETSARLWRERVERDIARGPLPAMLDKKVRR